MLTSKIIGAGGQGGGGVGGQLLTTTTSSSLSVPTHPGDLLICHVGDWAGQTAYFNSGVTYVSSSVSPYWSGTTHREDSISGYRICDGTEQYSFTAGGGSYYVQALALYRFDKPVVSVTTQTSGSSGNRLSLNLALSSYAKPHIAFMTQSAYQSNSAVVTTNTSDYVVKPSRALAIGLLNTEETNHSSISWTTSEVSFTEANSWGVITPNF